MGTRADFYIKKADEQELVWLASIAWDGYPDDDKTAILNAKTQTEYIAELQQFLNGRDDVTLPENGWPWPWNDSNTTDFAYCFVGDKVLTNNFGHGWHIYIPGQDNDDADKIWKHSFPDMSAIKNVRYDKGSGLIVLSVK